MIKDIAGKQVYWPEKEIFDLDALVPGEAYYILANAAFTVTFPECDGDYTLIWSDEFEGTEINMDNWTFETGATGWGNGELQYYTNGENAEVIDGKLIITARKVDDNMQPGSYTSSRMITMDKQEFQYGRMEINAKLPSGTGIWPAIWMMGSNFNSVGWPACGEIDIMEYVGYEPNVVHATVHTTSGSGGAGSGSSISLPTCEESFHTYGLIWTSEELIFYVDTPDNVVHTYAPEVKTNDNWPFNQPAFFLLNVAVGGSWGGAQGIDNSIFPQSMEVDFVRVYQKVN
jgi:beta-glucanase (GH16 family)